MEEWWRSYTGESGRRVVRRIFGQNSEATVSFLHASVPPIADALRPPPSKTLTAVLDSINSQLSKTCPLPGAETPAASLAEAIITDHWLLSVPESMRLTEEDVVNYLGMVVAIDFCHWAEVLPNDDTSRPAAVGEQVKGFAGFYTVVQPPLADKTMTNSKSSAFDASNECFVEFPDTNGETPGNTVSSVPMLRGSAAMIYLLRRAVEVHHIPWYDASYLQHFRGDTAAAMSALKVCFMGCEKDGKTPLLMPCAEKRVALLLSLAGAFRERQASFYQLLVGSEGRLFSGRSAFAGETAEEKRYGFIPELVRFHPRYRDFAEVTVVEPSCSKSPPHTRNARKTHVVPVLKLAQLTALAIEQALPELWRYLAVTQGTAPISSSSLSTESSSWLSRQAAKITRPAPTKIAEVAPVSSAIEGVFEDRTELSICCDYQIPKALRAAGLLVYNEHLGDMVDHHVLMAPNSAEESSIRVASLIAAERLLSYLNSDEQHHLRSCSNVDAQMNLLSGSPEEVGVRQCGVMHLDYALWYVGRYLVGSQARHHLCRTIMY